MNDLIRRYWSAYGGINALLSSPFFIISITISLLLIPAWTKPGWWDQPISVLPNLLGFSLGGFAMWMTIGDETFRKVIISDEDEDEDNNQKSNAPSSENRHTPYMEVNATFAHFIVVQIISLLYAIISKTYGESSGFGIMNFLFGESDNYIKILILHTAAFIGYSLFIYSILSTLAAVFAIFRISSWYDELYK